MNEIHQRTVISIQAPVEPDGVYQGWSPCMRWCEDTFGNQGWWYMTEGVFEFADPRDAFLFKLRWS